jgi:hypothetical protein
MSHAFYIRGLMKPTKASPTTTAHWSTVVLYAAPVQEAAEKWAFAYMTTLFPPGLPESKIEAVCSIPVHPFLLTSEGTEILDWEKLSGYTETHFRCRRLNSYRFTPNSGRTSEENYSTFVSDLKLNRPHGDDNWDHSKHEYSLYLHRTRAFIVKAINLDAGVWPYIRTVKGTSDGDYTFVSHSWPRVGQYSSI